MGHVGTAHTRLEDDRFSDWPRSVRGRYPASWGGTRRLRAQSARPCPYRGDLHRAGAFHARRAGRAHRGGLAPGWRRRYRRAVGHHLPRRHADGARSQAGLCHRRGAPRGRYGCARRCQRPACGRGRCRRGRCRVGAARLGDGPRGRRPGGGAARAPGIREQRLLRLAARRRRGGQGRLRRRRARDVAQARQQSPRAERH